MYYIVFNKNFPYGWTYDKNILKLFLKQRNDNYKAVKSSKNEVEKIFNRYEDKDSTMIDMIILKSASTGTEVKLFTTLYELQNCEKLIQRMINNQSRLIRISDNYTDIEKYVKMILNLKDHFYDALYFIGYRPEEIVAVYNSVCELNEVENIIDENYNELRILKKLSKEDSKLGGIDRNYLCSTNLLPDTYMKIIYSLESFIKVLINELRR